MTAIAHFALSFLSTRRIWALTRHVERRGRFVGDEHVGLLWNQRHAIITRWRMPTGNSMRISVQLRRCARSDGDRLDLGQATCEASGLEKSLVESRVR